MDQFDQPSMSAPRTSAAATVACVLAGLTVVAAAVVVVALRVANPGEEPAGQNWWLVAWSSLSLTFSVCGVALASRSGRRLLGGALAVCGFGAALTAVGTQYAGYVEHRDGRGWGWLVEAEIWARPLAAGMLVAVVPWLVARDGRRTLVRAVVTATAVAVVLAALAEVVPGLRPIGPAADLVVAASALAAVARLGLRWWRRRPAEPDPLPAWTFAGAAAAWLAVVPDSLDVGEWTLAGRDVVSALLLCATIPLLVGGAVVDAIRDRASPFLGVSHHVLEWGILAAGVVAVYTALVAGLGRLIGGGAPSWFLVVTTGVVAVLLDPARRRVRHLVDHLVYGARDDPLAVVGRIVDHLGADAGDEVLGGLVRTLRDELRLDAVAIDLRVGDEWQPGGRVGPPTTHERVVPLRHSDALVGRLVVGWTDGPSLRARDEAILEQLVGPLSLAVGWVRLTEDLRRSSVAIVSAREEERRRLRRDLHDGLGPSLTGVSLGLRTALRQLERAAGSDPGPAPRELLARVADEVDTSVEELKRIVRHLRPTALDQLGLVDAVAAFSRGLGSAVDITTDLPRGPVALPAAVEVATYRIVTEALTNVVRHAQAARCWLSIVTGPTVVIDVVDDGIGMAAADEAGVGLAAMHERAAELGGSVRVTSHDPRGTHVHVQLPVVTA